jgi:ABC-2 type transport system ATP-binding protein
MDSYIKLQNVSLKFRVFKNPSPALKETVLDKLLFRKQKDEILEFEALKDLSVNISSGERVGIIGLNGAGKSTLLRTIVGIYPPTKGTIYVAGKMIPLIEWTTKYLFKWRTISKDQGRDALSRTQNN